VTELDAGGLEAGLARVRAAKLESAVAEHAEVKLLGEASRAVKLAPREVSASALHAFLRSSERIARLASIDGPSAIVLTDVIRARCALEALDSQDFRERLHRARPDEEPVDDELVEACIRASSVAGAGVLSLGDLSGDTFLHDERELLPTPPQGNEPHVDVLRRDWLRFCGSLGSMAPPHWAEGKWLAHAAGVVERFVETVRAKTGKGERPQHARLRESVERLAQGMREAAKAKRAVVEWAADDG
jgi:hypothetical protein